MSLLPPGFQFSQRSLQDYVDCQRRFQLRYLEQLAWPAVESEPLIEHERQMQAGAAFHRLVQRFLVGIPAERLSAMLASSDPSTSDLQRWWENYLQFSNIVPGKGQLVEASLSAPLHSYRLLAKYDLVRWEGDPDNLRIKIYDWKTSLKKPTRQWMDHRLQTRVYPYLLAQTGNAIIGEQLVNPEQIEMIYWFVEQPKEAHIFTYRAERFQADHDYLLGLVEEIEALSEADFHLTTDESKCKFCTYRSLCDRGISAGRIDPGEIIDDSAGSEDFELDFDQVAEIEF
jgi:CRISPR/Cas system-associated exonuclease Cas4 (RecB family)